jgi:hypothetical protein
VGVGGCSGGAASQALAQADGASLAGHASAREPARPRRLRCRLRAYVCCGDVCAAPWPPSAPHTSGAPTPPHRGAASGVANASAVCTTARPPRPAGSGGGEGVARRICGLRAGAASALRSAHPREPRPCNRRIRSPARARHQRAMRHAAHTRRRCRVGYPRLRRRCRVDCTAERGTELSSARDAHPSRTLPSLSPCNQPLCSSFAQPPTNQPKMSAGRVIAAAGKGTYLKKGEPWGRVCGVGGDYQTYHTVVSSHARALFAPTLRPPPVPARIQMCIRW